VVAFGEQSQEKKNENGKEGELKPSRDLGKEEQAVHQ
jgi:hypothetical protein